MSENIVLQNIERLGDRYCRKYLDEWNNDELKNNWWYALDFFFSHSFMRGRRDELSIEYYSFTMNVLEEYFKIDSKNLDESYNHLKSKAEYFGSESILNIKNKYEIGRGNSIDHDEFKKLRKDNQLVNLLVTKKSGVKWGNEEFKKPIRLGNDEDVMMVLDVLKFISSEERKNIYKYLKTRIKSGGVKAAYDELVGDEQFKGIRAVSDKIATFILRDILLLNDEIKLKDEDYKVLFPVDTWVKQLYKKLSNDNTDPRNDKIKDYFIKECNKNKISPLKLNAGLWYLGTHALDILLDEFLNKYEIEDVKD